MATELNTESEIQDLLFSMIGQADISGDMDLGDLDQWQTYEEAGVLTTNAGLVLRTRNGAEFQITIVRSR